jgi:lysozyme
MNSEVLEILIPLLRDFEGCRLTPYKDSAGVLTIGYGYTGEGVCEGVSWTQETAEQRLVERAQQGLTQLIKVSPSLANVAPKRVAALADFVYNLGIGNYKSSTLKTRVNEGDWGAAAKEILRWDKCKGKSLAGLTKRRAVEAAMLT